MAGGARADGIAVVGVVGMAGGAKAADAAGGAKAVDARAGADDATDIRKLHHFLSDTYLEDLQV